jgi:NTE family protein
MTDRAVTPVPDARTANGWSASPPHAAQGDLAVVLTGGGARGAYQVGVLRWIARHYPQIRIPILTGVSAGAVNAAQLAAHHGTFPQAVTELAALWQELTLERVFELSPGLLALSGLRWAGRLLSGGMLRGPEVRALLDTQPLREYLEEVYAAVHGDIGGIEYNLGRGALRAVAVSTTDYSTGESVVWVQGEGIRPWRRPARRAIQTRLTVEHVMASAAIPLFFPAVRIGRSWYGDGGIKQTAPLSPAVHLGARRILAISTRYEQPGLGRRRRTVLGYPPPATVLGMLLNAVFLDLIEQDAARLVRFNELLERIPPARREGLHPIEFLALRPSMQLSRLVKRYERQLPGTFRFLTRGLGTTRTASPDLLSMLAFVPDYLERIMALGEHDAERHAERLAALLDPVATSGVAPGLTPASG